MSKVDTTRIDITGLDRSEVLAALCNNTKPQGLGQANSMASEIVTAKVCAEAFAEYGDVSPIRFDYFCGRPIKVAFRKDDNGEFITRADLYDRDAGPGMAQKVIDELRAR